MEERNQEKDYMKIKLPRIEEVEVEYLSLSVPVEDDEIPADLPGRNSATWSITIDIKRRKILGYQHHEMVHIHTKVVDRGCYSLSFIRADGSRSSISLEEEYVPSCLGEYGDYLVLTIASDGTLVDFKFNPKDFIAHASKEFKNEFDMEFLE